MPAMSLDAAALRRKLTKMRRGAVRDWIRGSSGGLVPIALFIGAGAGVGAIGFRYLILWFTRVFTGHNDYSAAVRHSSRAALARRGFSIMEAESLFNDGRIVVFGIALAAVSTGSLSWPSALFQFFWLTGGGLALGTGVGHVLSWLTATPGRPAGRDHVHRNRRVRWVPAG